MNGLASQFNAQNYPGLIEADCWSCASKKFEEAGGFWGNNNAFLGHPAQYSKCGNKRCPCAAHHDNACTGSNEAGQPGSNYPAHDPNAPRLTFKELRAMMTGDAE